MSRIEPARRLSNRRSYGGRGLATGEVGRKRATAKASGPGRLHQDRSPAFHQHHRDPDHQRRLSDAAGSHLRDRAGVHYHVNLDELMEKVSEHLSNFSR